MKSHINHMNGASNEMNRHLSSPLIHSPSMYLSLRWTTRLISSDHLNLICLSFDLSPWSLPVVALETKVPLILILLNLYSIPDWTADADAGPLITIFTAFFFFLLPVPRTLSPPVFYQMTAGPCWWTTPAANGQLWPKLKRRGGARRRRACMSLGRTKPFSHYVTISLKNSANENEKKKNLHLPSNMLCCEHIHGTNNTVQLMQSIQSIRHQERVRGIVIIKINMNLMLKEKSA